jgi:hypothetical protein
VIPKTTIASPCSRFRRMLAPSQPTVVAAGPPARNRRPRLGAVGRATTREALAAGGRDRVTQRTDLVDTDSDNHRETPNPSAWIRAHRGG